jgi:hypothetical protein
MLSFSVAIVLNYRTQFRRSHRVREILHFIAYNTTYTGAVTDCDRLRSIVPSSCLKTKGSHARLSAPAASPRPLTDLMIAIILNSCPPPGSAVSSSNSQVTVCNPGCTPSLTTANRPILLLYQPSSALSPAPFQDSRIIIPIPDNLDTLIFVLIHQTPHRTQPQIPASHRIDFHPPHIPYLNLKCRPRSGCLSSQVWLSLTVRIFPMHPPLVLYRMKRRRGVWRLFRYTPRPPGRSAMIGVRVPAVQDAQTRKDIEFGRVHEPAW